MRFDCPHTICLTGNLEHRADALVCAQCFRFVGSIEQQLQHRLLGNALDSTAGAPIHCSCPCVRQLMNAMQKPCGHAAEVPIAMLIDAGATAEGGTSGAQPAAAAACSHAANPSEHRHGYSHGHGGGSSSLAAAGGVPAQTCTAEAADHSHALRAGAEPGAEAAPAPEALAALDVSLRLIVSGGRLPRSHDFQLPAAAPCCGGCREDVYCSAACDEERRCALVVEAFTAVYVIARPGIRGQAPNRAASRRCKLACISLRRQHGKRITACCALAVTARRAAPFRMPWIASSGTPMAATTSSMLRHARSLEPAFGRSRRWGTAGG